MEFIKYNLSIFAFWFIYVLLKKPMKIEVIELLEKLYKSTPREQKLIKKVKSINLKRK